MNKLWLIVKKVQFANPIQKPPSENGTGEASGADGSANNGGSSGNNNSGSNNANNGGANSGIMHQSARGSQAGSNAQAPVESQ